MIRTTDRDRATVEKQSNSDRSNDQSKSPWPKRGAAGKVQPAKRTAPAEAEPLEILAVAFVADKEDKDVVTVWKEQTNYEVADFEGDAE